MTRRAVPAFAVASLLLACSLPVAAQEGRPEMSPEELAMMQKWQEYMTPGEPHARMARLVGTWDTTTRMWMAPDAPPEESPGTARFETIMDGRYLREHLESRVMGRPYKGLNLTGFDNLTQKYQAFYVDNMGTGMTLSEGTCDGPVCTYHGETPDPLAGKAKQVRMVTREIGDDELSFEIYEAGPDGKEFRSLEILYTRRK